ncbi:MULTISPECIES: Gfo/Idh/MocA family oxidoreductase [unclassified Rhizobium]|uniref:Gfo/Idh/MocA family oxidoreductase n=1 Tax=unclassified Rhizobium TaxID=2613769 RepID=UPI000BC45588|nr:MULTISPECIES: Gfo/Idh/MocA family oxidoreductase [unclassified Rhizobium]MDH7808641.1 myo-inositol 2-dehydrogenase/D-chiro-inositol 1-dehydrogenase [Rhizobium sp. AN67]MDQ4408858.1 Gfo/Idh/MocA family oxidoreductase [Rhizobium sp. AN63]SOD50735.1 myo-inositol 2-dehydrogenase / D-chiro-inositol 1-dehydrogenase [Rhizobium sp. AN6A]
MTTRIAIIGAGLMGADHAKIVAEDLPGATLQVVCDMNADRARKVAEAYGAHDIDADPERVADRSDVDAVIIASPDFTHAPLSLSCINAGKRVLCEKPLSQSSKECIDIMRAEQVAGSKHIMLGFMRRFDQSYVEMKRTIQDGTLGRALMMHNFHRNVSTPAADFTGAMAITNSAPHEFDVARHVLETEYVSISAFQPKRSDSLVAPVHMVLETEDGQLVNIEINNNAAYGYDVRAELVGEKATIAMNAINYTRIDRALGQSTSYEADWRGRYAEAYRRQNRAFLRFVETEAFPDIASSSWDGYCAAVVAEAGVRALDEGRKIPIKMIVKPEFYA